MREIGKLAKKIEEEAKDACCYAEIALWMRDNGNRELGQTVADIAKQEISHAERLHDVVVRLVDEAKASDSANVDGMATVWEWIHDDLMEKVAHARQMVSMYSS